jgi:predicted transcriptional regulator
LVPLPIQCTLRAYRSRVTKNGVVSTALLESYRKDGKPRRRTIANLHGATLETALGRLAAERDALRKERARQPDLEAVRRFHKTVLSGDLCGDRYGDFDMDKTTPQEIDRRYREAGKILKRVAAIDRELDRIKREGVAIKRHCTASAEAIRTEAVKHAAHLREAEALKMFDEFRRGGKSV